MMNLDLPPMCILYAVVGTIEDLIVSRYYIAVAARRPVRAANISSIHTVLAVWIVASVVVSRSILPLAFYVLGGWIGTYFGVKNRPRNP